MALDVFSYLKIVKRIGMALMCLALLLWSGTASRVWAQGTSWEEPINISNSAGESQGPSITVDPSGVVHVVWHEREVGEGGQEAIYYTSYDGDTWSPPIDILVPSGEDQVVEGAQIAADEAGILHLVWIGGYGDQMFYSQAYAPAAGSAKGWRAPVTIGESLPQARVSDLIVDQVGNLHVVYIVKISQQSGVYYSQSADQGWTWKDPLLVYANLDPERMVGGARLAVDDAGVIHVVWTEYKFPDTFPPLGIRYAQSDDGGQTWTAPLLIDGPYDHSGIITVGKEQVHHIWSGTNPDRFKFHRWSTDQGATWFPPFHTSEIGGYQGQPGLATDSLDRVHLLQVWGSGHEVLGHRVWNGSGWSPEITLLETPTNLPRAKLGTTASPNNPSVAVGLGNELHVVAAQWVEHTPGQWAFDIFYIGGLADAPGLEPQVLPAPTVVASPTLIVRSISTAKTTPTPFKPTPVPAANLAEPLGGVNSDPTFVILVGVLPPFVLLVGVVIVRLLQRRF